MLSSPSRVATTIIVGILLVACTSAASPASIMTPTSSPTSGPPAVTTPPPTSTPPAASPAMPAMAAGGSHACALTSGGGARCWGENEYGQLGNGTTTRSSVPVDVAGLSSSVPVDVAGLSSGVTAITAGLLHTCALTRGGGVVCWGDNFAGQLGDGTTINSNVPVDVAGLASGVVAIAAGASHTCGLTSGGGAKCWGDNFAGQLGNGNTTISRVPVDVSGLASGVRAIAVGFSFMCALTNGGGVKCWGWNDPDQLPTNDGSVPVDVAGLAGGISAIAAGENHACALTSGGGVKCWGYNGSGILGDGTTTNSTVPVDAAGLESGVIAIATGDHHTCALTKGGGVKCWGSNRYGQLGNGTTAESGVPVDVSGLASGVIAISADGLFTCALTTGAGVKCWGNTYGLATYSSIPVDADFLAP